MSKTNYDWIVIGAGAAGLAVGEMLSRVGNKVLILEKNKLLAAETSRIFHEWLHTGALYTLVPDRLQTTRFLLGAMDDLFEYYSCYGRMNLNGSEAGLSLRGKGWFNDDHIIYKYRHRMLNPIWSTAVARSRWLINEINNHDWLRKRAGVMHSGFRFNMLEFYKYYPLTKEEFTTVDSPDITINSRILLSDLIYTFEAQGGEFRTDCNINAINDLGDKVIVTSNIGQFYGRHVVICAADGLSKYTGFSVKKSYAPMFVVENLNEGAKSFVELDYYPKSCINLINKGDGYGLAGGISVEQESSVADYLDYCIKLHRMRNPEIKVVDKYTGIKKELVKSGQPRNYLYHINKINSNVWSVVLGKFTLMFSLAPEFFRRVYNLNPPRFIKFDINVSTSIHPKLSRTKWYDIVNERSKYGND